MDQDQLYTSKYYLYTQRVLSASFGGSCVTILVTPFDVVKSRLQAQANKSIGSLKHNQLNGMMDAFIKIGRIEGLPALWRGLYPSLMMQLPASALYFPIYEVVKENVLSYNPSSFWQAPVIAGLVSRTITVTVVSPMELVRTNLQSNAIADKSIEGNTMRKSFINIIQRHGWKQLWGGLGPTLLRDVPFSSIYWSGFEYAKILLNKRIDKSIPLSATKKLGYDFIAGFSAGTLASIVSNPFDVIKTQRQMSLHSADKKLQSILGICKSIIKENGYKGFMNGLLPRTAKVAPGCAIMISSYEFCKRYLIPVPVDEINIKKK